MSATCSRMYAEQVITFSARLAIHFSTPWMWDCGCLSTQPWWRPYSVAWIVTTNGQRKRLARWSPATATSQSWPCTTSKEKRSPTSTPAASMSAFMCSIQVTNSDSSRGRSGSRTRWTITPSTSSSAGDSSSPRASTWTSVSCATRFSASLRTWRARPPSISGGYSQERMRTRMPSAPSLSEQEPDAELGGAGVAGRVGGTDRDRDRDPLVASQRAGHPKPRGAWEGEAEEDAAAAGHTLAQCPQATRPRRARHRSRRAQAGGHGLAGPEGDRDPPRARVLALLRGQAQPRLGPVGRRRRRLTRGG